MKSPNKTGDFFYFVSNSRIAINFICATLFYTFFSRTVHMLVEILQGCWK